MKFFTVCSLLLFLVWAYILSCKGPRTVYYAYTPSDTEMYSWITESMR